jgi:hypothetical protein
MASIMVFLLRKGFVSENLGLPLKSLAVCPIIRELIKKASKLGSFGFFKP